MKKETLDKANELANKIELINHLLKNIEIPNEGNFDEDYNYTAILYEERQLDHSPIGHVELNNYISFDILHPAIINACKYERIKLQTEFDNLI